MGAATNRTKRWWERKGPKARQDILGALAALRADVENQGNKSVVISHLSVYRQRQLTDIRTTRVGEWTLGYRVIALNENEGFYLRSVFAKLEGGRLDEINAEERRRIVEAIAEGALDKGSFAEFEAISDVSFAFHQPFAVMFWNEGNPNIVTPSKELILGSVTPPAKVPIIGPERN